MYSYIDLFSGCGGLSDGFEQTGVYKGLAHVEWEPTPARTLIQRLKTKWGIKDADKRVICFDIQKTNELIHGWSNEEFGQSGGLSHCVGDYKKIDVLIGGPPCQAYSIAGRIRDGNGMHDDYRNFLFESYIDVMKWASPDIFVFENVLGILSAAPGGIPIIDRIHKAFSDAGYVTLTNFKDAIFHLNEFGVPQKRSRVIIIGLRKEAYSDLGDLTKVLDEFYAEFRRESKVKMQVNAKEALNGLTKYHPYSPREQQTKKISHGLHNSDYLNHTPRFHSQRDIGIFELLAKDIEEGTNFYTSIEAIKDLYTSKTGKVSEVHKYHVIRPNEPSNTIPAHLYKDGLRHIHWDSTQARTITVREAARLQTFDDDFEFLGSMGDQYKMIGNAVPPLFSKKLAKALVGLLAARSKSSSVSE